MADVPISKAARKSRSWLMPVAGVFVASAALACCLPVVLKQRKAADRTTAISSLKGIGLALQEFEAEYGRYPDESTASIVKEATHTPLDLRGSSSNRLFRQLLAIGIKSEKIYHAPGRGYRRGDDRFDTDANALAPGECGFAYLTGNGQGNWDPSAVLAVAPLIPGSRRFDPEPYGQRGVLLRRDNSASAGSITGDGRLFLGEMDLFDDRNPCWRGRAPVIHWQEPPP